MKDIAIIGKAGSGKDTVAKLLNKIVTPSFDRLAFADAMKEFYHDIFNVPTEPKPRHGYQWFGQVMREHDPNVWVKQMEERFQRSKAMYNGEPVIITDVRQPNEYEWCYKNGFIFVKVTAVDDVRLDRMRRRGDDFKPEDLNHETESYIDNFDYDFLINNSGTIENLKPQIKKLVGILNRQE